MGATVSYITLCMRESSCACVRVSVKSPTMDAALNYKKPTDDNNNNNDVDNNHFVSSSCI